MNSPDGTVWGKVIYERESLPLGPEYTDRELFVRALFMEMGMRELRERILGMMSIREAIACAKEGATYKDEALSEFINSVAPFLEAEKLKKHEEIAKMLEEETQKAYKIRPIAMPTRRSPFMRRKT